MAIDSQSINTKAMAVILQGMHASLKEDIPQKTKRCKWKGVIQYELPRNGSVRSDFSGLFGPLVAPFLAERNPRGYRARYCRNCVNGKA